MLFTISENAIPFITRINKLATESQKVKRFSLDDDAVFAAIAGMTQTLLDGIQKTEPGNFTRHETRSANFTDVADLPDAENQSVCKE